MAVILRTIETSRTQSLPDFSRNSFGIFAERLFTNALRKSRLVWPIFVIQNGITGRTRNRQRPEKCCVPIHSVDLTRTMHREAQYYYETYCDLEH